MTKTTLDEDLRQEIIAAEKKGDRLLLDKDYWGAAAEYQRVFEYYSKMRNIDSFTINVKKGQSCFSGFIRNR